MRLVLSAVVILAMVPAVSGAQSPPRIVLENERVAVGLEAGRGGIASLVDKATGRNLVAAVAKPLLFQLEFSPADTKSAERVVVSNLDAAGMNAEREGAGPGGSIELRFSDVAGKKIEVRCRASATAGDPFIRWRLEADFPASLVLENVRFPVVTVAPDAVGTENDAVVLGATKGGVHPRPSGWKVGRGVSAAQPGSLAAQMGCYYGQEAGVLTAALDSRGYRKAIYAGRTGDGLLLVWQQPCFAKSHFVQDFDFALATFGPSEPGRAADWRDGADLYKAWAVEQPWCRRRFADRDDLPGWLKSGPAMVRFSRSWLADPPSIDRWLKEYWKGHFASETPLVIAYWGWEKVDTWITPDYFPVYPSDDEFRRLAQLGRELGGHTFLWPSGYHYTLTYKKLPSGEFEWDARATFDAEARPHAVVDRQGKTLIGDRSWLQGGQTATMCPGDPWTIEWMNRTARGLAERGAELIQVDQVVGGNFPPCYSTEHGHPPGPGLWATEVFREQLVSMSRQCREILPEAVVCFEEPNELFIQEVGIQDYRDWEVMRQETIEPASVFNYLYHEYLPTFQSNPQAGNRLQTAWCLVTGQIPHFVPSMAQGPGPLLAGGDFERWPGKNPAGWEQVDGYQGRAYSGNAARDDGERHGGRSSLRLTNTEAGQIVQVSQNVAVGATFAPGRTYRLRAWLKTAGLKQPNGIMMGAFTRDMKHLGSWSIAMPREAGDWSESAAQFKLPESAELLRIMLHVNGPGTVWIDDIVLEEIGADGRAAAVERPKIPSDHELMRQWVDLYHGRGRDYLQHGRMLHPPRLEVETISYQGRTFPAILHNAFAAADGSEAVVMVNASEKPQVGKLHWKGRVVDVRLEPWEVRLMR